MELAKGDLVRVVGDHVTISDYTSVGRQDIGIVGCIGRVWGEGYIKGHVSVYIKEHGLVSIHPSNLKKISVLEQTLCEKE